LKKPISPKGEASYKSVNKNIGDALEHFTTHQLANTLKIDKTTIRRWIKKGKVKGMKMRAQYVIPKEEAFELIFKKVYDDVNLKINAGDSVSIKNFKDELKKVIQLSEEEVNKILLALDDEEVLHLQTVDNPGELTEEERKVAIEFNGRTLFYIT
jgi:excisionase family DNA binding protein